MDIDKEIWQTATTKRGDAFKALPLVRCEDGKYAPLLMRKQAGVSEVEPDPNMDYWTGTLPRLLELAQELELKDTVSVRLVSDHIRTAVRAEMAKQQLNEQLYQPFPVWLTRHVLDEDGGYLEKMTAVNKADGVWVQFADPFARMLLQDKQENVNWFRTEEAAMIRASKMIQHAVDECMAKANKLLGRRLTVKETK